MLVSLSGRQRDGHKAMFERLFRLRYDVFVTGRRWTLPTRDGLDIDQYDGPDAQYFFIMDDNGDLRGHVRLTPTMRHSLLADYFPHLVEGSDQPRGITVYEATRYIVRPSDKNKCSTRRAKAELLNAVMEWAMTRGITEVQTVIDAAALTSFLEITSECRPLGLSHAYGGGVTVLGGGEAMAIRCRVSERAIHDIRAYGDLPCGLCQPCVNHSRLEAEAA
jgi:acyl-homoserine lactone synthase